MKSRLKKGAYGIAIDRPGMDRANECRLIRNTAGMRQQLSIQLDAALHRPFC
ncbi:hypothetical protein VSU19_22855 [Verrucomicrobiales bacterium BCK34]|nr:hypothetical protein [Verrucomicrobiales bacterium BCK34]